MPMTLEQREAFLAKPRYAVITTLTGQGRPVSVPVWYEWDGSTMAMFTTPGTGKVTRLTANPFASVLVMTNLDESEAWVSMDGKVEILDQGGDELAQRLTLHYWDMNDPARATAAASWKQTHIVQLKFTPDKIRTYNGD